MECLASGCVAIERECKVHHFIYKPPLVVYELEEGFILFDDPLSSILYLKQQQRALHLSENREREEQGACKNKKRIHHSTAPFCLFFYAVRIDVIRRCLRRPPACLLATVRLLLPPHQPHCAQSVLQIILIIKLIGFDLYRLFKSFYILYLNIIDVYKVCRWRMIAPTPLSTGRGWNRGGSIEEGS